MQSTVGLYADLYVKIRPKKKSKVKRFKWGAGHGPAQTGPWSTLTEVTSEL